MIATAISVLLKETVSVSYKTMIPTRIHPMNPEIRMAPEVLITPVVPVMMGRAAQMALADPLARLKAMEIRGGARRTQFF